MYGAREGHHSVCLELIKHGADLNLQDGDGCTALMIAAQVGVVRVYEDLVKNGADVTLMNTKGVTALTMAHPNMLKYLESEST